MLSGAIQPFTVECDGLLEAVAFLFSRESLCNILETFLLCSLKINTRTVTVQELHFSWFAPHLSYIFSQQKNLFFFFFLS